MKKLINIFAPKPKAVHVKPQIKVSHTIVPEGYTGDFSKFNETFLNIHTESFKAYERLRQN